MLVGNNEKLHSTPVMGGGKCLLDWRGSSCLAEPFIPGVAISSAAPDVTFVSLSTSDHLSGALKLLFSEFFQIVADHTPIQS